MKTIKHEMIYCIDVDETLVFHVSGSDHHDLVIKYESIKEEYPVLIHELHRKLVKEMKHRGRYIIVWSARGYEWAEIVVRTLGLENDVDLILSKPLGYVDDIDANEFMKRIYIQRK